MVLPRLLGQPKTLFELKRESMRKLKPALLLLCALFFMGGAQGQGDLFDGLFEKERPVFHPELIATSDTGVVQLVLYFTHSKLDDLEMSVWLKDQGAMLRGEGKKQLVGGLRTLRNRQMDTILLRNLSNLHFYTVGIDYRNPNALSRKFQSNVLRESFRYEAPRATPELPRREASRSEPVAPARPSRERAAPPCVNPDISVSVDPAGYCGDANRPAVKIQCLNCYGQRWDFAVETRTEDGPWAGLRADGIRQTAEGAALRTEPLCALRPDVYYVRVLAWGEHCTTPVIFGAGPIVVLEPSRRDFVTKSVDPIETAPPVAPLPALPEECQAEGEATIDGDLISGTVELPQRSPCADYHTYAQVTYINPGYRDITLNRFPLQPGVQAPFDIRLDERDLRRGIHTIQVVVYVRESSMVEGVPVHSFWIRAEKEEGPYRSREAYSSRPSFEPLKSEPYEATRRPYESPPVYTEDSDIATRGFEPEPAFPSSFSDDIDTLSVTASDPNCTQVQDMQLVFDPNRPDQPLYISWLSPRCCQEEGCSYTVWAGKNPDQLRLLVRGNKPGAFVRELLEGQLPTDRYFEVVVNTANGKRKAAYVLGEGPKYGFEEVLEYRDRRRPPKSDSLAFFKLEPYEYQQPERPINEFAPCKYRRATSLVADGPVEEGDEFTVKYDFSDKGYRYTLYFLPEGSDQWVLAPGTREEQRIPAFTMTATPFHTGRYLVLASKKNWGCLSAPLTEGLTVDVRTEGEVAR